MQHILLTFIFGLLSLWATAQISPIQFDNETVELRTQITAENGDDAFSFIAKGRITNVSPETVEVKWTRMIMDAPDEWVPQTCDFNACWSPAVVSNIDESLELNEPLILAPGESSNMDIYINPNFVAGEGTFEIQIGMVDAPEEVLTSATYHFDLENTTTAVEDFDYNAIQLFPNPTTDYVQLTHVNDLDELVVYNLLGQAVRRFVAQEGVRYQLGDLADGTYLLSLVSYEKGIVKTLRVSKYDMRP